MTQGGDDGSIPTGSEGTSCCRIGTEWVKVAWQNGWQLIRQVCFSANSDPEPAITSRQQHQKRLYRLEFKVLTFEFEPD